MREAGLDLAAGAVALEEGRELSAHDQLFAKVGTKRPAALAALDLAVPVFQTVADADPGNVNHRLDLAGVWMSEGTIHLERGDGPPALERFAQARALLDELLAVDAANALARRELALCLGNIGRAHQLQGDSAAGRKFADESHDQFARAAAAAPAHPQTLFDLSLSHLRLGDYERTQSRFRPALDHFREAVKLRERVVALDAASDRRRNDLDAARCKAADMLVVLGEAAEALAIFRVSYAHWRGRVAGDPNNLLHAQGLALACERLADGCRPLGDSGAELAAARESLALRRRIAEADEKNSNAQFRIVLSHLRMGYAALGEGVIPLAREHLQNAADLLQTLETEKRVPNPKQAAMIARDVQGRLQLCQMVERAAADPSQVSKYPTNTVPSVLTALAVVLARQGRHADAADAADRLAAIDESNGTQLFDAARTFALCVPVVDEPGIRERYAARATDLLRRAVDKGIKQTNRLQLDPALDAVRGRPDFPKP